MDIKMKQIESIPANENPFRHDSFNMGQSMGSNLTIMFGNHEDEECRYLILCFTDGCRYRLDFGEFEEGLVEKVMKSWDSGMIDWDKLDQDIKDGKNYPFEE